MSDKEATAAEEPEWSDEDMTEDEWRRLISYSLRDELNDSREDVYTPEDGQPIEEIRENT